MEQKSYWEVICFINIFTGYNYELVFSSWHQMLRCYALILCDPFSVTFSWSVLSCLLILESSGCRISFPSSDSLLNVTSQVKLKKQNNNNKKLNKKNPKKLIHFFLLFIKGYLIGGDVLRLLHGHMDECLTVPSGEHGEEQRR